jgi:hypothetical protein
MGLFIECEKCGLCKGCGAWNKAICSCQDNHDCEPNKDKEDEEEL